MKSLFTIAMLATSLNSFAGNTCVVKRLFNQEGKLDKTLARYENIDTSKNVSINTLIKEDGSIIKNFKYESLFEGMNIDNLDVDAITETIKGSRLAIINANQKEIELYITDFKAVSNISEVNASLAIGDINSKKIAIKDLKNNLSIICTK